MHLATQPCQLAAFLAGQAVLANALIEVGLLEPVAQTLPGDAQLATQLLRLAPGAESSDGLRPGKWR